MPIKNYTSNVDVYTTVGQIQSCLVKHGARKIVTDYDEGGSLSAVCFLIDTPTGQHGIRLPANVDAVQAVLSKQKVKATHEQAERTAWRIIKDWVEAQMAIIESEMVQMDEIFLPYMLNDSGETLYQLYQSKQLLLEGQA